MSTANALAAIVNIFMPGVGQLIQGRVMAGIFFVLCTAIGYFLLVIPGIIVHIWTIVDAAKYKE